MAWTDTNPVTSPDDIVTKTDYDIFWDNIDYLNSLDTEGVIQSNIIPITSTSIPTGYLFCDGSAISRTTYSNLFSKIGVIYGSGNGSTTFNIPDYRGRFLRGRDGSANLDPDASSRSNRGDGTTGDNMGTTQTDQFINHRHSVGWKDNLNNTGTSYIFNDTGSDTSRGTQTDGGGNETRPENIYVNYCIKY